MFRKTALLLVCVAGVHVAGGEWLLLQSGFSGIPGFFARIGEPGVLRVDTRTGRDHWNILWVNESNLLTAGNRYRISLRYRILAKEGDGGLAFIARPCNVEHHREDLHAENGTAGEWSRVQFEVRIPEDAVPYTLQIHAWGKIAAEIDSLKISRAGSPFRVVRPEVAEADKVPTGSVEFEVRRPHFPADPVVVDGAEFGFSETAEDNTPAWERAMAACRKRNASRLILPSGTFRFLSPNPLKIERFHDFEIDGNGAQFIFYRAEKSMHSSFMALSFNRRFAMRNLRIDWDWERMPLASVVRARRVDPLRHWVELEFTQYEDVPFRDVMRIADVEQLDPVTMSVGCENSKGALFEFIPGAYPPADMEWTASNRLLLRRITAQQSHFFENIHPGELFRMRHFSYDSGAFHLDDNQEIVLEDITIFGAPGFGVLLTGRDQKFVELRRVKVIPPKGSERCISSCADPVHSSQSSGFLKLEDCEFGFSGDDCVNIADTNGLVTVTAPDRLQLSTISLGTFRVGDPLELRELNFAPTGRRVTVRRLLPDGRNDGSGSLEISEPLPPELSVLIDGGGLDQRKSFCKTVKSAGAAVEIFNAVKATDRRFADGRKESLREICGSLGKSLEPAAAQFLTETIGGDSGMLRNELEKLCSYVGDAAVITLADCREVCSRTPETVSWEFTGAIVGRDRPRALRLLDIMLRQGEPEIRLMYALSGEFQKLIQTRLAMKQLKLTRVTPRTFDSLPESLKKEFPDNPLLKLHPFRAFKTCEGAAGFTDAELAGNLEAVRNASRALVSGGGEPRIILEQLVLRLTARR